MQRTHLDPAASGTSRTPLPETPDFDAVEVVKNLREAEFSESQTAAIMKTVQQFRHGLATETGVKKVQLATEASVKELKLSTDAQFKEAKRSTDAQFEEAKRSTDAQFKEARLIVEAKFDAVQAQIKESRLAAEAGTEKLGADLRMQIVEMGSRLENKFLAQYAEVHKGQKHFLYTALGSVLAMLALMEIFGK